MAELKKMVQAELDDYTTSNWDDLGFVLKGEASKTYWVGRSAATGEITLDLKRVNNESVDLQSILSALDKHRAQIMKILD